MTCDQIGACSDTCAAACPGGLAKFTCMINCSKDCKAKGCTTAQPVYQTLYNCISTQCAIACMGGPSAGCKTCVSSKCTAQVAACSAQAC